MGELPHFYTNSVTQESYFPSNHRQNYIFEIANILAYLALGDPPPSKYDNFWQELRGLTYDLILRISWTLGNILS
jgi:hypothetical protein